MKAFARMEGDAVHLRINILGDAYLNCVSGDVFDSFKGFRHGVIDLYFRIIDSVVTFDPNQMHLNIEVPPDEDLGYGH